MSYLLLLTFITSFPTPPPALSRDRRGLLHLARFGVPRGLIVGRQWSGHTGVVPRVARCTRGRYQMGMRRQAIWCQKTPIVQIHRCFRLLFNQIKMGTNYRAGPFRNTCGTWGRDAEQEPARPAKSRVRCAGNRRKTCGFHDVFWDSLDRRRENRGNTCC